MDAFDAVVSALGLLLLLGISLAIWMYAFAHALWNHAQRGIAFFMIFVPGVSLLYVLFHRCSNVTAPA